MVCPLILKINRALSLVSPDDKHPAELFTYLKSIPQHTEVPPHIEAK
jgi:hypothetical protein